MNQGPQQACLDGLSDPTVDIVTLFTRDPGLHIELLHYWTPTLSFPKTIRPGDVAATLNTIEIAGDIAAHGSRTDPNGHLLRFTACSP